MNTTAATGWRTETVTVLGARQRVGDENFQHGVRPQVRAMLGRLVIANELGDVHAFMGPLDAPRSVPISVFDAVENQLKPLSRSAFPSPEHYRYAAAFPTDAAGRAWTLVTSQSQFGITHSFPVRRCDESGIELGARSDLIKQAGIPEAIDWRGDGKHDLLLGTLDGRLLRFQRILDATDLAFEFVGEAVTGGDVPMAYEGPLSPCVVDWDGRNKCDLLIGTGDGQVLLSRDVSEGAGVTLSRPQRLCVNDVPIRVEGAASATVFEEAGQRWLIVADGKGAIWHWPMNAAASLVLDGASLALTGARKTHETGQWWLMDHHGTMLLAAAPRTIPGKPAKRSDIVHFDPPAPELTLALPEAARGWHEIQITLLQPEGPWEPRVIARLSPDPFGRPLMGGETHTGPRQTFTLDAADLRGQSLILRQLVGALGFDGGFPVYVQQVRLIPRQPPLVQVRAKGPRIGGIFDAFMWWWHYRGQSARDVEEVVEWHKRSGIDTIYYKLGGAAWEYPSRVPGAESVAPKAPDAPEFSDDDHHYCQRIKELWESFDRPGATIEACHQRGMTCFAWLRIQNENEHFFGKFPVSRFYFDHQDLCEKDIHGRSVRGKLCLAYPQVRKFLIDLACEGMSKGADGVMIDTMRHLPKVMYGDPVVEAFRKQHGIDMRSLPPFDPRVMDAQVQWMSLFLREVRDAIRAIRSDAQLHMRICKPYPLMGVAPGRWAREGLVDALLIEDRVKARRPDLKGLMRAIDGSACAAGYSFTRTTWGGEKLPLDPVVIAREAAWAREAGATIVAFYETADLLARPEFGKAIRAIG